MTTGVTPQGFVAKTVEEILAGTEADELIDVDAALDTAPDQPIGQLNGIYSKKSAEIWEAIATAYDAFDPDRAEDSLLDAICALTGTVRIPAKASKVSCTVNLDAGATLPAGSVANVTGQPLIRFESVADVTNSGGSPANVTVMFKSQDLGPVVANAGTLEVITAAVTGWNSITNPLDATLGSLKESDAKLRARRKQELAASGACTTDAVRADLLNDENVLSVYVFENTGMSTDVNGLPPKSFECVVYDGPGQLADPAIIAKTIWDNKPSGMATYGQIATTITDSQGNSQVVRWSRPTLRNVYFEYDIVTDSDFPADGVAQCKAASVGQAAHLSLGNDVVALVLRACVLAVAGVVDVTALRLGFSASPVGIVNLAIGSRELAVADTTRILVNGA